MSYRITYGSKTPKKYRTKKQTPKFLMLTAAIIIGGVGISHVFPNQMIQIRHALLPWTTPQSQAAIQTMITDMQHGTSCGDAITTFCTNIIHGQ